MRHEGQAVNHRGVPLHTVRPSSTPVGTMVLFQEAFGVNDHIQDVAGRFAGQGYVVAIPHLFHRQAMQLFSYEDLPAAKQALGQLDPAEVASDTRAATSWLTSDDGLAGSHPVAVGFCFGGKASFLAATSVDGLSACVSFYGAGIAAEDDPHAPIHGAARISCPVLALYGGGDPYISSDEVGRVDAALEAAGVAHEVHTYPGADHGFFCDARPATHDAAAAEDAWRRTLRFLANATAETGAR